MNIALRYLKFQRVILFLGKDTGLSVALFISVVMTSSTKSMVSFTIPWTCHTKKEWYDPLEMIKKFIEYNFLKKGKNESRNAGMPYAIIFLTCCPLFV